MKKEKIINEMVGNGNNNFWTIWIQAIWGFNRK